MKLLTTNKRVQFTIQFSGMQPSKKVKEKRKELLEQSLLDNNLFIDEVFPRKQAQVIDTILYYLSASGIAKSGRDSLANKCECSIRTISDVVSKIREMSYLNILVGKLKGTNKYVFVDLLHSNAKEILKDVFCLSDVEIAHQFARTFAHHSEPINVDMTGLDGENSSPNNLTNLSKQTNKNYLSINKEYLYRLEMQEMQQAIQNEIEDQAKFNNSREFVVKYASNPYQIALYDFLDGFPLPNIMKEVKAVMALRIGSDATPKTFDKATNLVMHMAKRIQQGLAYDNVVAAFSRGLEKAMKYEVKPSYEPEWNWLEERDSAPTKSPKFYNWLDERE